MTFFFFYFFCEGQLLEPLKGLLLSLGQSLINTCTETDRLFGKVSGRSVMDAEFGLKKARLLLCPSYLRSGLDFG